MFSHLKEDEVIRNSKQGQITTLKQDSQVAIEDYPAKVILSNQNIRHSNASAASLIGTDQFTPGPLVRDSYKIGTTEGSIDEMHGAKLNI